jgi:glycosyltransferase involved in cell wall biosynthesis
MVRKPAIKEISVVIPTFNEKDHLINLLNSLSEVDYPSERYEVIVVSDGATDGTPVMVNAHFPGVRVIALENNLGRYEARKTGVNEAKFEHILFVDSRTLVDPDILKVINQTDSQAIKGFVECGNPSNPFHIFFESIRYKLYPEFYRKRHTPFEITLDNFEKSPKGTGVFYVSKQVLSTVYDDLSAIKMGKISSDDTLLIKTIAKYTPVTHHPGVKITRYIRDSFLENVLHLIYRGSTFVYYYLDPRKRLFWLVIVAPVIAVVGLLALFFILQIPWFVVLMIFGFLDLALAIFLGNTLAETLVILWMIPVCGSAFYLGILRGIFRRVFKIT